LEVLETDWALIRGLELINRGRAALVLADGKLTQVTMGVGQVHSRYEDMGRGWESVWSSGDGRLICAAGDGGVYLWGTPGGGAISSSDPPPSGGNTNPTTEGDVRSLRFDKEKFGDARFFPKSHHVLLWGGFFDDGGPLFVLDAETGQEIRRINPNTGKNRCLTIAADGKKLLGGADGGGLWMYDLDKNDFLWQRPVHRHDPTSVALSPDGRLAMSYGLLDPLRVRSAATGTDLGQVALPARATGDVFITADSKSFLIAHESNGLYVVSLVDLQGGRERLRCIGDDRRIKRPIMSPDGNRILALADDGKLWVWDAVAGKEIRTVMAGDAGNAHQAQILHLSPNGHRAILGVAPNIAIWDLEAGKLLQEKKLNHFNSSAASDDGRYVVTGHIGGAVQIWRVPEE
jgi:WD40 repeat protein